ncbi:MAG: thiamine pyrophosphate-binding protein [Dehalococcoidia bacterium]
MAMVTGGALALRALKKQGIPYLFGLTGEHIYPLLDACEKEGIRFIDVRHEQAAVHAADGWARVTGRPGAAAVVAGPGITNAVTGVANAFQASSPLILLGGHAHIELFLRGPLQEMESVPILSSITKWANTVYETKRIPESINTALKYALGGRPGPAFLACPQDVLEAEVEEAEVPLPDPERTRSTSAVPGNPELVREAARLLAQAQRPAVLAGSSVFWSRGWEELRGFIETLGAPLFLNAMGRGCMPPDHPLLFGRSRRFAMGQADVILIIGAPIDFRLSYGQPPLFPEEAQVIQVDIDQVEIAHNRPVDVGIMGDAREVLKQLTGELQRMERRRDSNWVERVWGEERERERQLEPFFSSDAVPLHPLRLLREIRDFLDEDAVVIGDGGAFVTMAAGVIRAHYPGHWLDTGKLGCLGVGTSFALAARLAHPDKQVLLLQGDGSFGLNGMEFDTAVRHKLPFVAVIGNNGGWSEGAAEPDSPRKYLLGFTHYEKIVEALGGYGEWVERPQDIRPALERAFKAGVPAALNVPLDPRALATT